MGKKSGPSPPPAPDPTATAQAQAQYNREAAIAQANLNRIDQYTPQGSITYTQIGTNADGTPRYRQDQVYSPEQQALYDQQNQVAQALGGLANNNIDRVAATQGQDFNFNGMTPLQTGVNAPNVQQFTGNLPNVRTSIGNVGSVQGSIANAGPIQRGINSNLPLRTSANGGQIQRSVGPNDFSADARRVANAVYGQAASRLNPQFQQEASDLTTKLANEGIPVGSQAWQREMDNFNRAKNDAYQQANFNAIQAGGNEQSRLFGLDLSRGQFANQAQSQAYGQDLNNANLNNAAMQERFGFDMGRGQFANQAQAQQFAQNEARGQFANQAQDQRYTQALGAGEFANNAGQLRLQQQLAALGFNNQAGSQAFNQNLANANLNNQGRQQEIQEATYLRNLPLNDIAALLGTGGGVQQPEFNPFAQVGVAAPDYQGGVWNGYNAQMNMYNQQQAARSQMLGSIFGTVGSLGSAAIMASDRRLKTAVVRVGTLANGLATYAFNYIGDNVRRFGVMAQDVLRVTPDAVVTMPNDYLAVDYRKVW